MSKMVPQLSTAVSAVLAALLISTFGVGFQPEFAEPLENLTIPVGRDAVFRCMVQHLGGYRVGWVKADTKAIQAIHDHVITHNPRVSVSHSDHTTWNLQVRAVQEEDRGAYMCQINTDPMKSQMGYLDVVVPPDFVNEETSGDAMVPEGGTAKLTCKARGYPTPHVTWRREDSVEIVVKDVTGKTKVSSYQGEVLKLAKITRSEMGAYLCIASNGIPPSVSKRILVNVHFHPVIQVPNQLVGAPTGTDVTLECYVEASPKSINYWVRDSGEMVISSEKYEVQGVTRSLFEVKMVLVIRGFNRQDVGSYRCIAKNSLGEVESNIRLYEIPGPVRKVYPGPPYDEEDQQYEVYGSAEDQDQDELSNSVQLVPGWERQPTSGSPARTGSPGVQVVEPAHSGATRPGGLLGQVVSWIMAKGSSSLGLKEGKRSKAQEWIVAAILTWRRTVLGRFSGEMVSWIKAIGSETLELNEVTSISNANEWILTTVLSWRRFFLQLGFNNYVEDEMILAVSKQSDDSRDKLDACGLKFSR